MMRRFGWLFLILAAAAVGVLATESYAQAPPPASQPRKAAPPPDKAELRRGRQVLPVAPAPATKGKAESAPIVPEAPETVQADVSTKTVPVSSSFTGTEIIVFGAVDNSRQPAAEAGTYDIVIVVEGTPGRLAVRKKSRIGGIWLNTRNANFDDVPSYYAIWSTRPLEDIASEATMIGYEIGFDHVRMTPVGGTDPAGSSSKLPAADAGEFRSALVRLKTQEGLYVKNEFGVTFIGRSLFRANIALPPNVTVGPFDTRVYLFRNEKLLSQYNVRLNLEREGVERYLHNFAFSWPLIYGVATVLLAVAAGLAAATVSGKGLR
jgi:uncharacterized protein (TIGR02186 family)